MMDDWVRRPPIIALAQNAWDGPWMNRQELLSRLVARGWTVIYSNGTHSLRSCTGSRWRNASITSRFRESDGILIDEPGRLVVSLPRQSWWNKRLMKHQAQRLRDAVTRKRGDSLIVQVFSPRFLDDAKALDPTFLAFHIHDFYPGFRGWTSNNQRKLDELAERADLITLAGPEMISCLPRSLQHRARPLYNAGNPERYIDATSEPCPADLGEIPRPRIGYVGNINGKCDFDLVLRLADMRPDWQWVFVGKVMLPSSSDQSLWHACLERVNVHWLGMKDRLDVAGYVAHMDVNALTFRVRGENVGWVQYSNPLRINAYLASGNPVIGADMPALRRLDSLVEVGKNTGEWLRALERAITSSDDVARARRQAFARQTSWDTQARQLEHWLNESANEMAPSNADSNEVTN